MKTIVYVDGYNLFYGCLKHSRDKWLDLYSLFADHILQAQQPRSTSVSIKFFTADIKASVASYGSKAQQAQHTYHRALTTIHGSKISIIKGYYSLEKAHLLEYRKPPDKTARVEVWKLEEKQTDVNMALEAYRDAVKRYADQLVFVSNDTDIAPALSAIREDFGGSVRMGVVIPRRKSSSGRPGNQSLSHYADWTRNYITDKEFSDSQLPGKIPTHRKPILKPEYW